jgi:hypothetical protein
MALLCVSQQGEFTNTIFLGGKSMSIFLAEKAEKKKTFFLSSFPLDFF